MKLQRMVIERLQNHEAEIESETFHLIEMLRGKSSSEEQVKSVSERIEIAKVKKQEILWVLDLAN